jgi:hypothetical protein
MIHISKVYSEASLSITSRSCFPLSPKGKPRVRLPFEILPMNHCQDLSVDENSPYGVTGADALIVG